MSWTEPDSTWQQAERRRLRRMRIFYGVIGGIYVLALAGLFVLLATALREVPADGPASSRWFELVLVLLAILGPAILVVMAIVLFRGERSERRVLLTVPDLDGQVCMRCRLPLSGERSRRRCAKCGLEISHEKARSYWEQYPHQAGSTAFHRAALDDLARLPGRAGRMARFQMWINDHPVQYWAGGAVLLLVYVAVSSRLSSSPFIPSLISTLGFVVPMLAIFLCLPVGTKRVGASLHCPKCEYQKAAGDTGPTCPECGSPWRGPGATVKGRLVRATRRQLVGAAILLIFGGAMISRFVTGRSVFTAVTPSAVLARQAFAPGFSSGAAWDELGRRRLTAEQERRLFEQLLDTRRRGEHFPYRSDVWMRGRLAAGPLPAGLVDRFYGEQIEARIVPPAGARVGRPSDAVVEFTQFGHDLPTGVWPFILVEGFALDDAIRFEGRISRILRADAYSSSIEAAAKYRHQGVIVPEHSGPTTVRFAYWHFAGPLGLAKNEFAWNEDGSPKLPATVAWSRRVVIESGIVVE